jgi:hypothetical protein
MRRVGWGACPDEVGALIFEEVEKDCLCEWIEEDVRRERGKDKGVLQNGICSRCPEMILKRGTAREGARAAVRVAG